MAEAEQGPSKDPARQAVQSLSGNLLLGAVFVLILFFGIMAKFSADPLSAKYMDLAEKCVVALLGLGVGRGLK